MKFLIDHDGQKIHKSVFVNDRCMTNSKPSDWDSLVEEAALQAFTQKNYSYCVHCFQAYVG